MSGKKNVEHLKVKYKDDPSYKDEEEMAHVGLNSSDIQLTHDELMKLKVKPREFILYPILSVKGQLLVHAAAGVGKSHFCFNLAYAAASGGRFLKYEASSPRRVLYVDGELGQDDVHRYVKQIEDKQGKLDFPENMLYLTRNRFPQSKIPKLDTTSGRKWYDKYIFDNNIEMVVWDSLKMLSTIDENKTKDWDPIQEWFGELNDRKVSIVLIHHAGGDVTKQRGVTARNDAVNTAISLQKLNLEEEDGKVKVVYQKTRFFHSKEAMAFEAQNHFDGSWSFREIEFSFDELVLDLVKRGDKVTQIAIDLKAHRSKVYRAIDRLKMRGIIC